MEQKFVGLIRPKFISRYFWKSRRFCQPRPTPVGPYSSDRGIELALKFIWSRNCFPKVIGRLKLERDRDIRSWKIRILQLHFFSIPSLFKPLMKNSFFKYLFQNCVWPCPWISSKDTCLGINCSCIRTFHWNPPRSHQLHSRHINIRVIPTPTRGPNPYQISSGA